jgi:hypothetical protein
MSLPPAEAAMRSTFLFPILILLLSSCRSEPDKPDTGAPDEACDRYADEDGDGFGDPEVTATGPCVDPEDGWVDNAGDCDDGDPAIHPDAEEACNGVDDDCDGEVDEGLLSSWYADEDGDGHGDPDSPLEACEQPSGHVDSGDDCDDADPEIHPGAPERCDGVDQDCDGEVDEDLQTRWYLDSDGDGHGDAETALDSCDPGQGWVDDDTDCDDGDERIHPGADERCNDLDDDCDGLVDEDLESTWYADDDSDGYGDPDTAVVDCDPGAGWVQPAAGEDCDDANSAINPAATETCNGYDDDCDGLVDDQDPGVADSATWYLDGDGDGYGDDASTQQACAQPSGTSALGGDCDDDDPAYNPGASEADCTDPSDYNCDGSVGWADDDGDGWAACEDCDDRDAAVNPDGEELCNGVDDDCDGAVDEADASDATTWYADADGDGYGDVDSTTLACAAPSGTVADATDCVDTDATINPAAPEACNGVDDDCDGTVDEGVLSSWYADADADGYGDAGDSTEACTAPSGNVADATDCDDADGAINPAADELCNGYDDDCDGIVDEADATDAATWYQDHDADGYGDAGASTVACDQPSGTVADGTDCDDADAAINPAADELCNGIDDDCDGTVDTGALDASSWYADADADGYGDPTSSTVACTQPSGTVADDSDCDDADAAINPAAAELCDGADNDCDGRTDEDDASDATAWYADADADGYGDPTSSTVACTQPSGTVADDSDCDDADAAINPAAAEICDGTDNDCDGAVDDADPDLDATTTSTWYADADGDGYGDAATTTASCEPPTGTVADDSDCDDADGSINPAAAELCDGVDQDCSGALSWLEQDADGDGLLACELSLWLRSDGTINNDPATSGTYGSSEAAGLLAAEGLDFDTADTSTTTLSAALLDNYGLLVMHGTAAYGTLDASESAVLEDWVRDGGSLLYLAYHPSALTCAMVDSLPSAFGLGCSDYASYWSGSATSVVPHAVTADISTIEGMGGEHWTVSSPAQTIVDQAGWPVVVVLELEDGRMVGLSDEWPLYDSGTGSADISQGDNRFLLENTWAWLTDFAL